jgi:hypothetical protein
MFRQLQPTATRLLVQVSRLHPAAPLVSSRRPSMVTLWQLAPGGHRAAAPGGFLQLA